MSDDALTEGQARALRIMERVANTGKPHIKLHYLPTMAGGRWAAHVIHGTFDWWVYNKATPMACANALRRELVWPCAASAWPQPRAAQ